ncbi:MAG: efflux RND transporter periplasmic adaptor subunit [Gammaproteobacteria bacterium]|nr:efflux RND transporter periplasmic adaptor subunit [Gammaproteobacteria bacterium]MBU1653954.1 efflux RND transporter periplasmic adaptor subunit [Gammaproteobacteria bacterium]MBU1960158.1 efflux RND transporter periplasmic adaptor subunit [Gammaproteobacteria bacterium]
MKPASAALLLILPALLGGCGDGQDTGDTGQHKRPVHRVETLTVRSEPVSLQPERAGSLKIRRQVRIHSQEEGRITQLPFFEGDAVKEGELLAGLDDSLLRAELQKAEANLHKARLDAERLAGLADKRLVSEDERARVSTSLEVAEAEGNLLKTRLDHTRITAPFAGLVSERLVEPGDLVARFDHLLTLIDPDSLIVQVSISELLLPSLTRGAPVAIRIDALPGEGFRGRILRIHPRLDAASRQGTVEVSFEQVPPLARGGQLARVSFSIPPRDRLLVPFTAIQRDREGEYLFLARQGKAHRVRIETGLRIGEGVEVLSGLAPGDQVVTRGFMGLTEGKEIGTHE